MPRAHSACATTVAPRLASHEEPSAGSVWCWGRTTGRAAGDGSLDQAGVRGSDERIDHERRVAPGDRRAIGAVARRRPFPAERPDEDAVGRPRFAQNVHLAS
jgi:hypothetical protein